MIRDLDTSKYQWMMVLPVKRRLKAASGERTSIGIVIVLRRW